MKKLLSLILSILMLFTMVTPAFAATTELDEAALAGLDVSLKTIAGDDGLTALGVTKIDDSPAKYLFKLASVTDGEYTGEYVLLKNVNASDENSYFVITNGATQTGIAYNTAASTKTKEHLIFDVDTEGSIAKTLNSDTYYQGYFKSLNDYILTNTWYTEGTNSTVGLSPYKADYKISLLSLTEYVENADRIGFVVDDSLQQWWSRTPHPTVTAFAMWEFLHNADTTRKINNAATLTSTWAYRGVRPCFYLNENFFKEVKLDMTYLTTEDSEAAKIIKNIAATEEGLTALKETYTTDELIEIGIAAGNVEITSATLAGTGECDKTLVANVTTQGEATTTEYEWIRVNADGTQDTLDSTTNSYTVKYADLGASIKCFVKVYEGETLSHSAYTNTVATETKPTFPTYSSITLTGTAADGVKDTPAQYKFSVDGRELILLKSVNADADDGQFVTLEVPVNDQSVVYYDVADATEFNALTKVIYDPDDTKSMAYDVNQTTFWDKETKADAAGTKAKIIPDSLRSYLNTHRWWNEGINNATGDYYQDAWATESKVAILSYTEYRENIDRIGFVDENGCAMVVRTARYDSTGVSATAKNPQFVGIGSSEYTEGSTKYRFTQIGVTSGNEKTYLYWHSKPIAFYLNPEFFANVKVDFTEENTEVIAILREKLEGKTKTELVDMGYSYSDIKILFPDLAGDINDVEMYNFTAEAGENGSYTITYFSENTTDAAITFKPVAAAYASSALVDSYLAAESLTLEAGEAKASTFTINIGTNAISDVSVKTFVWNIDNLMPLAPCADVELATLGSEP